MNEFRAGQFWWMSQELVRLESELSEPVDKMAWAGELDARLTYFKSQCEHMGLKTIDIEMLPFCNIVAELQRFKLTVDYAINVGDIRREIRAFRKNLEVVLCARKFITVSKKNSKYFEQEKLFGDAIYDKFPDAREDIKDAGNCIAVDLGTAAVFHLMRAVEWGLRELCRRLGLLKIRKSKKPGRIKYVPMEYAQWEQILTDLQDRVDAKINVLKPGKTKQQAQEFYYPLLHDIKGFKDAWRNHVMHTRRNYTVLDAEAILDHVKRFMCLLASK